MEEMEIQQSLPGFYDGNPKRKTDRPSAEKRLKAFCNLTLYFLPDSTIFITPINFLASLPLVLSLQVLGYPAFAQTLSQCNRQQEIFTFQVSNYAISHQSGTMLNIKVAYSLTPEASAKNDYPNFIPITKEIGNYLTDYPNNNDYWEIVNKNLVKRLLDKYPQMSSLTIELGVMPKANEPFARSSIVGMTRPQGCPIVLKI